MELLKDFRNYIESENIIGEFFIPYSNGEKPEDVVTAPDKNAGSAVMDMESESESGCQLIRNIKNRIVIDYPTDQLILTAIREIYTGAYREVDVMEFDAEPYNIPVVNRWQGDYDGIAEFVEHVKDLEGEEGYILRFDDGHMLKQKNTWYVQLHKTKELLQFEKDVWALILANQHDDAKAFMEQEDKDRIDAFAEDLYAAIDVTVDRLKWIVIAAKDNLNDSKKRFAIEIVNEHEPRVERSLLFKIWDENDPREVVYDHIRSHLGSGTKLEEVRCLADNILWGDY